ncbi:hypothetical protein [Roseobacter sp. OBYS 0001]|uniref:hypothetical protein n=1 Tax=Roseobacter sp. OBYS 0001 TaxID=882651 RepID=UPI001C7EA1F5|nr:hypothetical protein [Roseobacter sp. OBYS 0001]
MSLITLLMAEKANSEDLNSRDIEINFSNDKNRMRASYHLNGPDEMDIIVRILCERSDTTSIFFGFRSASKTDPTLQNLYQKRIDVSLSALRFVIYAGDRLVRFSDLHAPLIYIEEEDVFVFFTEDLSNQPTEELRDIILSMTEPFFEYDISFSLGRGRSTKAYETGFLASGGSAERFISQTIIRDFCFGL